MSRPKLPVDPTDDIDRWSAFTFQELETLKGALNDSSGMRSDVAWYKRCHELRRQILEIEEPEAKGVHYGIRSEMSYRPGKPVRDPGYLKFIRSFPCLVCGRYRVTDPHHFGPRGIGQKTSDFYAVPLCREHHREVHKLGPRAFQEQYRLDIPNYIEHLNALWEEKRMRKTA